MTPRCPPLGRDEEGVTLVELIVYIAIGALFAGLVASIFVSGLHSQAQTRDRDAATGKAQVVTDMLQASLRNADAVHVDGQVLVARVATGATGWECRGWALTADGAILYAHGSGVLTTADTTWTPLVGPADRDGASVSVEGGGDPFTLTGTQLDYLFTVRAGTASVPVRGSVTPQAVAEEAVSTCW